MDLKREKFAIKIVDILLNSPRLFIKVLFVDNGFRGYLKEFSFSGKPKSSKYKKIK